MSNTLTLKFIQHNDRKSIDEIVTLRNAHEETHLHREGLIENLEQGNKILVLHDSKGALVGYTIYQEATEDKRFYVVDFYINPEFINTPYNQSVHQFDNGETIDIKQRKTACNHLLIQLMGVATADIKLDFTNVDSLNNEVITALNNFDFPDRIIGANDTHEGQWQRRQTTGRYDEPSAPPQDDTPLDELPLTKRLGLALEKLIEATGVEWNIFSPSRHKTFTNTSGIYFRTSGKMKKPYAVYHAIRKELKIDPDYPESYVNPSGLADKVRIPTNWADNILQADLPTGCLAGMCIPSDREIGGNFGEDFLPFR